MTVPPSQDPISPGRRFHDGAGALRTAGLGELFHGHGERGRLMAISQVADFSTRTSGQLEAMPCSNPRIGGAGRLRAGLANPLGLETFGTGVGAARSSFAESTGRSRAGSAGRFTFSASVPIDRTNGNLRPRRGSCP